MAFFFNFRSYIILEFKVDFLLIFFCRLGYPCPMNFNPADYFVHTLAIVPGEEEQCKERVKVRNILVIITTVKYRCNIANMRNSE